MLLINFFNINFDIYLTMRILFENIDDYFIGYIDYGLVDLTSRYDPYIIISIVMSILNIICLIYSLYTEPPPDLSDSELEDERGKEKKLKPMNGMKNIFCFVCIKLKKYFRPPNFFEILSK